MPSLTKLRSSSSGKEVLRAEPTDWGVDKQGQFYDHCGKTKLCSQLQPEDKRYMAPLSTKDLTADILGGIIQESLEALKGFKVMVHATENYFHARYGHRLVRSTDDIEVFINPFSCLIHFRSSTKETLNGLGVRHKSRMAQLVQDLQPKITAAAERAVAVMRTNRIYEWDSAIIRGTGHEEVDDPCSVYIPPSPRDRDRHPDEGLDEYAVM